MDFFIYYFLDKTRIKLHLRLARLGVIGGTLITRTASAQSTAPVAVAPSQAPNMENQQGTFKSNEDAAHEAKESKEWEAQEDAGQRPWTNGVKK